MEKKALFLYRVCAQQTVEKGEMTKDLAVLVYGDDVKGKYLNTQDFLAALKRNLDKKSGS